MEQYRLDRARSAWLDDVGGEGLVAASVLSEAGETLLLLCRADAPSNWTAPMPPHEQVGPLPDEVARRLWRRRVEYCGRTTQSGRPCRFPVKGPGAGCRWHR